MTDWKAKLGKDYDHFFGNENQWRNDLHPEDRGESETVSTVTIHAIDTIAEGDYHTASVKHVRGFHGKGFMPHVRSEHGYSISNGDVFYGTNQDTYDKAVQAARETLQRMDQEFADEMARIEAASIQRKTPPNDNVPPPQTNLGSPEV